MAANVENDYSHNEKKMSVFELERAHLVSEISQEIVDLVSQVKQLNQNLQTVMNNGQELNQMTKIWQEFTAKSNSARNYTLDDNQNQT